MISHLVGWIFENNRRLEIHLLRIIKGWHSSPKVPRTTNQFVFPELAIPNLDRQLQVLSGESSEYNSVIQITESIERYDTYWMSKSVQVRQELHLFPPKSRLEEEVFTVRNPAYWRLYE